jgi:hypothetical protein
LAKSKLRGYRELLMGLVIASSKGAKGHEEFMLRNDIAFAEPMIASGYDICLGIVNSSSSEDMPECDACFAWKNLVAKFEPVTKANLIKMKCKFSESRLDSGQDPDQWIQTDEMKAADSWEYHV